MSASFLCPLCNSTSHVSDSRRSRNGVRRRRGCDNEACGARWTTYEIYVGGAQVDLQLGVALYNVETAMRALERTRDAMGVLTAPPTVGGGNGD